MAFCPFLPVDTIPLTLGAYRAIVDQAPILIWRSDKTGACNYFNERWLNFTGRSFEQEKGDGWSKGVHPDDLEQCLKTYLEAFSKREKFQMQYRLRRRDEVYRWVSDCGVPFTDENEEFSGYIGSCIDVTDSVEFAVFMKKAQEKELKTLRGLLPICASCKKIRDDRGYWNRIEVYIREHSEADFSHGICPDCAKKLFPEVSDG